ncbi:MAG TPA: asparagine synthase (glutamine-hydrolyzing) [Flavisolibacter sp.]|jgi:asparagine synthase (glutamine-hydrolysing)|nr:asparagine synthase (glutamine-hydrolyzing) [Flavisolibacter sp.]
MCGIAGIVSKNSSLVSNDRIGAAVKCLKHRGPEGEDVWVNEESTIALGHLRLRIIDLSNEAAQPMHCFDRYTIVHNGELYNYIEIRQELLKEGYHFHSQSDTEVIVAAYDLWGNKCLQQFDGMFAFAIWDEKEKKLFAARDRFGEKPFFFFYDKEQLLFASEMKSLWSMSVRKDVNQAMLYNFLTIGYTTNPSDPQETFYQNIYKLPAACFLDFSLEDNQLQIEKYWQVYPEVKTISEQEAIEQFRYLFMQSIKRRLRSDVSIGTSLSGGLDSSTIVAFCDQQLSDHYSHKCFTASFGDFQKDELKYAEIVANKFELEHYATEISGNETVKLMQQLMHHQEEPITTASPLAQYKVFQLAKQNGVTVLLDGQGADETLAGYHKYFRWYWQELYRNNQLKKSSEQNAAKALGIRESFGLKSKIAALYPEFAAGILQTKKSKEAFRHPDFNRGFAFLNKQSFYYATSSTFDLNGVLYYNSFVNGLEELLRLADRNSMAHAIEVRLPFLEHSLIEFLFSLPPGLKIHNGWTKWLLRKSVEDFLPKEIVWRKDKVGFEPPQKLWMEDKSVQDAIMEGKKKLVQHHVLNDFVLTKKIKPHDAYAANNWDWKYWSASYLFN